MIKAIILFAIGLMCLIKGGDWFVDGATGIAHKYHMPELLIGATIVSIGTTLPEVMVSSTAAVLGHSQIAYGNAIGSIICNTALILALTAAVKPQNVERKGLLVPAVFFFVAAGFYVGVAYISGHFSRITGILLLCIFAAYMIKLIKEAVSQSGKGNQVISEQKSEDTENAENTEGEKPKSIGLLLVMLVVGAALIAVGADLLVDNGTIIAEIMGVPESVIALTFVALGTSLPELVTAITALAKGYGALSIGNVIGANLFNLVLVNGLACILCPFDIPANNYIVGINSSLVVDVPVMLIVMLLAIVPTIAKGKIARWQGITLMGTYAAFVVFQFVA